MSYTFGNRPYSWLVIRLGLAEDLIEDDRRGALLVCLNRSSHKILAKPAGIIDAASNPGPLTGVVTMAVVVLWCVINPFFEEAMEAGYFVRVLHVGGDYGTGSFLC